MKHGYLVKNNFFPKDILKNILTEVEKRLSILEMEGKFDIRRPKSAIQGASPLPETDKYMDYSLINLEKNLDEFEYLKRISNLLFFLPFEINQRAQLNLQVSEHFTASYLSEDAEKSYINEKRDSGFSSSTDAGVKLTILYAINGEKGGANLSMT